MSTPVRPDRYARAAGYEPTDFKAAVQSGQSDYAGVPIGSWRQDGGEYLAVPDGHADRLGLSPAEGRSNPVGAASTSEQVQKAQSILAGTGEGKSVGAAAAEAAPPVSANASAAYAAGQFAETVKEQPQVMEDVADTAGFLGSLAFGYATGEGEVVKSGLMAAFAFGVFKGARAWANQADRRTDMQERQQRHQIQQQRQEQLPANGQKQLGGQKRNGRGSGVTVHAS
jgi:hypothetical protein